MCACVAPATILPMATGCTALPSADGVEADSAAQSSAAIVVVERTSGPGDAVRRDDVVARFVRAQGPIDEARLRLVGISSDLPLPGTCVELEALGGARPLSASSRGVELLDVGVVTLDDPQGPRARTTELAPREIPDPAGVVSGVIYSARAIEAFTSGTALRLRVSGGADADAFVAQLNAPREIAQAEATLTTGGVDVTWDARDSDPRDVIYVEILTATSTAVRRCASTDTGHLFVGFGDGAPLDEGQVVVHRFRREALQGKGVPDGEVRFDLARIVSFSR